MIAAHIHKNYFYFLITLNLIKISLSSTFKNNICESFINRIWVVWPNLETDSTFLFQIVHLKMQVTTILAASLWGRQYRTVTVLRDGRVIRFVW